MRLYLVRHAIAYERDGSRWPDDRGRPLTAAGIERFRRAARGVRKVAGRIETVLTSPLTRARQTADILTEVAGWPPALDCEALEPDRPPVEALAAVHRTAGESIALVGHEPNLSELVAYLIGGSDGNAFVMKKGGVASLTSDNGLVAGSATLRWLVTPKIARAIEG